MPWIPLPPLMAQALLLACALLACSDEAAQPMSYPRAETVLPEGHNPRIPLLGRRPFEAQQGERTLWIRGTVEGLASGQVRFHEAEGEALRVICLGEVIQGRFETEAPPASPLPVYVSVVALGEEEPVEGPHAWGALEAPIRLEGQDLELSLHLGSTATWVEKADPPIDRIVQLQEVLDKGPSPAGQGG